MGADAVPFVYDMYLPYPHCPACVEFLYLHILEMRQEWGGGVGQAVLPMCSLLCLYGRRAGYQGLKLSHMCLGGRQAGRQAGASTAGIRDRGRAMEVGDHRWLGHGVCDTPAMGGTQVPGQGARGVGRWKKKETEYKDGER